METVTEPAVWKRQNIRVAVAAVVVLLAAGVMAARPTSPADPGIEACRLMRGDLETSVMPDPDRWTRELDSLQASRNADLRTAGAALSNADLTSPRAVAEAEDAIGRLYLGCRDLGVPLTLNPPTE